MFSSSIILSNVLRLCEFIKKSYRESLIYTNLKKSLFSTRDLYERSTILQTIKNRDIEVSIQNSIILNSVKNYKAIPSNLGKLVNKSSILKYLMENNIIFYNFIFILIILPFAPTTVSVGLVGMEIILIIFGNSFRKDSFHYPKAYLLFLSIFIVSILMGSIFNIDFVRGLELSIIYIISIGFGALLPFIRIDRHKLELLLKAIIFTTTILCLYGLYQFIFGVSINEGWTDTAFGANVVRIYSTFGNPNVFGEYLVLTIPIIFGFFIHEEKHISKFFHFLILVLAIANLFMTFSRGSILGLIIALFIIIVLKMPEYLPIGLILMVLVLFFLPQSLLERILSIFSRKDTSTSYRRAIYGGSINMLRNYHIQGVGLGQFKQIYKLYAFKDAISFHAHNTYLMIYIELGILGIASFLLMILTWSRNIFSALKYKSDKINIFSISIFAGIIGCSIQGIVDHIWHNYTILLMYFILLGLGCASVSIAKEAGGSDG